MTETEIVGIRRPIPLISTDAKLLYERLKQLSVGDFVSYEDLNTIVGRDVRNGARGPYMTARRRAERLDGIVLACIHNEGLKRLSDPEIVDAGRDAIKRVRNASRRAARRTSRIQSFDGLDQDHKARHNAHMSLFSALAHITKNNQVKRLEDRVGQVQATLPLARVLELFSQ